MRRQIQVLPHADIFWRRKPGRHVGIRPSCRGVCYRFVPFFEIGSLRSTGCAPAPRTQECRVAFALLELSKRTRAAILLSNRLVSFLNRAPIASLPTDFNRFCFVSLLPSVSSESLFGINRIAGSLVGPFHPVVSGTPPVGATGVGRIMIAGRGGFMLRPGAQPGTSSNSSRNSSFSPLFGSSMNPNTEINLHEAAERAETQTLLLCLVEENTVPSCCS